ncbi:hypothetical protein CK203_029750 [Vitis vinifera]|uniref:Uncharacterized protein n=1 Tax=Vitis vinifera TaxID=29760 RepID=A0A438IID5_VITVI|nr:hypothetical protein CK203_029750 [Vitis vinifera]
MEELALVHDSRFYSMEEHMDQYQTGVTSRFDHFQQRFERIEERMDQQQATFEHLQQRIDRIESRQASQHEEMMAYLRSVFPPTPSALRLSRHPLPFLFYVAKGEKFIGSRDPHACFRGQKGSTGRGYGQPVNRLRNGRPLWSSVEDRSEVKNLLSLPVAFSSRRGDSLTGRGPVEATVTCHALNAPTASEPVDP